LNLQVDLVDEKLGEMIDGLQSRQYMLLRKRFVSLPRRRITIATFFSGTEIYFIMWMRLAAMCHALFGSKLELSLEWTVEKDAWKRDFTGPRTPSKHAFADVIQLAKDNWKGHDFVTGGQERLYSTDIAAAGFECDTVSKLTHDSTASACMELQSGKTGTTGRATLLCIVRFRFALTFLENSSILGLRNIMYIINYLNFYGFYVYHCLIKGEKHGSPSRRERQIMLVTPVSETEIDQTESSFVHPAWVKEMALCLESVEIGPGNPDRVLLDMADPLYLEFLDTMGKDRDEKREKEQKRKKAAEKVRRSRESWEVQPDDDGGCENYEADHLELYKNNQLDWPPDIESVPELAVGVQHLQRRMQEAAFFHCARPRSAEEQHARTFHDLQPSLKFLSSVVDQTNTIVCTSVIFDRLRKKVLSGLELLLLQGYPLELLLRDDLPSNVHMTELAGNAFNAWAVLAVMVSALASGALMLQDKSEEMSVSSGSCSLSENSESEGEADESGEAAESEAPVTPSSLSSSESDDAGS